MKNIKHKKILWLGDDQKPSLHHFLTTCHNTQDVVYIALPSYITNCSKMKIIPLLLFSLGTMWL